MVKLIISFNGYSYEIPVNPEELTITRKATNSNIDLLGIGKATRKGEPELATIQIKSFFPALNSRFDTLNITPLDYIKFIETVWNTDNTNNNVPQLQTIGLDNDFTMYFVIDSFDYSYKGGDFDVYYTLKIKEYRPYGVKEYKISSEGMATARVTSVSSEEIDSNGVTATKSYTVVSGDNLSAITKRCTGNSSQWRELYELNKDIISNPNLIYPGQQLKLPDGWDAPRTTTTKSYTNYSQNKKINSHSDTDRSHNNKTNKSIIVDGKEVTLSEINKEIMAERNKVKDLGTRALPLTGVNSNLKISSWYTGG